jgi:hypothetical protein
MRLLCRFWSGSKIMTKTAWPNRSAAAVLAVASLVLAAVALSSSLALYQPPPVDLKPVTVQVVDADTGAPVTEFTVSYSLQTPDGRGDKNRSKVQTHKSNAGELTLQAPISGVLTLKITAREYLAGYGHGYFAFNLKAADAVRKSVVKLRRGVTVTGTVRDARTKSPIQGASIASRIFTPPGTSADWDRAVTSDKDGRFTLPGADPDWGISIKHTDYLDTSLSVRNSARENAGKIISGVEALLDQNDPITGRVNNPAGQPLARVAIWDASGKKISAGNDGKFVFKSPHKYGGEGGADELHFRKDGFIPKTLSVKDVPPGGLIVVLEPLFEIRGHVLGPAGEPVSKFTVMAGPGRNPADYQCSTAIVTSGKGDFVLTSESVGEHWIGVRADGFACWEGTANVGRGTSPMIITLQPGVRVTGSVTLPPVSKGPWEMTLTPRRPNREYSSDPTPVRVLSTLHAPVTADGTYAFPHVRPDDYQLSVAGKGITPRNQPLTVIAKDTAVAPLVLVGTGRLTGRIFGPEGGEDNGKPWAFASAHIRGSDNRHDVKKSLMADEEGRFAVEDVACGDLIVGINYSISADIVGTYQRIVRVVPGQTTDVRFFDPATRTAAEVDVVIGDGSQAQFETGTGMAASRKVGNVTTRAPMLHVRLAPSADRPCSFPAADWHTIDSAKNSWIVLSDVTPGRYRIQVRNWGGSMGLHGLLFETEANLGPGRPSVRVPLGGGSVIGQIQWTVPYLHMIGVTGASADGKTIRQTYCDGDGNFCLPYLTPGSWDLFAQDDAAGWRHLGPVVVKNDAADCGLHKLQSGASVTGRVTSATVDLAKCTVVAVDARGVTAEAPEPPDATTGYRIGGLWPGRWTLKLMHDDTILTTATVNVTGAEQTRCDLTER